MPHTFPSPPPAPLPHTFTWLPPPHCQVDDDCFYPPSLVGSLIHHLPSDHGAVSGYCEEPLSLLPGTWMRTDGISYHQRFYQGHSAECRGWLMGFGGVAYWASSFGNDIFDFLKGLPEGCFFHDDVWLSG